MAPRQGVDGRDKAGAVVVGDPDGREHLLQLIHEQRETRLGLALEVLLPREIGGGLRETALDQRKRALGILPKDVRELGGGRAVGAQLRYRSFAQQRVG